MTAEKQQALAEASAATADDQRRLAERSAAAATREQLNSVVEELSARAKLLGASAELPLAVQSVLYGYLLHCRRERVLPPESSLVDAVDGEACGLNPNLLGSLQATLDRLVERPSDLGDTPDGTIGVLSIPPGTGYMVAAGPGRRTQLIEVTRTESGDPRDRVLQTLDRLGRTVLSASVGMLPGDPDAPGWRHGRRPILAAGDMTGRITLVGLPAHRLGATGRSAVERVNAPVVALAFSPQRSPCLGYRPGRQGGPTVSVHDGRRAVGVWESEESSGVNTLLL